MDAMADDAASEGRRTRGDAVGWLLVAAALVLTVLLFQLAASAVVNRMITVCTADPAQVSEQTPLCPPD